MKTIFPLLLFCFFPICILAQPKGDELITSQGPLVIYPIHHGSLVFTWNGKTIYVDPYGGAQRYKGLPKPDLILITDIHPDHLNPETLEGLNAGVVPIIAPQAVVEVIPDFYKPLVKVLQNGGHSSVFGCEITAIPMYNLPEEAESKHPKGRGNGYVVKMGDKSLYISGDTEDIPEMRELKNIDVAFMCMNVPYTMDIQQAADAVLSFQPGIVYPYHYRGKDGLSDVNAFEKLVNANNKKIEVRLRNWYTSN